MHQYIFLYFRIFYIYVHISLFFLYSGTIYTSVAGWKELRDTLMWPHAPDLCVSYIYLYINMGHTPQRKRHRAALRFSCFERKKNNDNNYNGVPGPAGGRKTAVPADTVDTLRGGRKGDPQHKVEGKNSRWRRFEISLCSENLFPETRLY